MPDILQCVAHVLLMFCSCVANVLAVYRNARYFTMCTCLEMFADKELVR